MAAAIDRILAALSLLSTQPEGMSVLALAHALDMPASAAHRLLNDLVRLGFATQPQPQGNYALTLRLAALGLGYLGAAGITDIAAPVLDGLARTSGELVRLSVVDGDALIWVAAAQGATSGLRYDPAREQGARAPLAHSASGRAWAATLPEDRALRLIAAQPAEPPPVPARNPPPIWRACSRCWRRSARRAMPKPRTAFWRAWPPSPCLCPVRPALAACRSPGRGAPDGGPPRGPAARPAHSRPRTGRAVTGFGLVPDAPGMTRQCDLLVIGSGAAGLAAAVVAAHHGLRVILAEKAPVLGGTTAWSGGWIWAPGNPVCARHGTQDSAEAAATYLRAALGPQYDDARVQAFLAEAPRMVDFFDRHTRLQFDPGSQIPDTYGHLPGAGRGGRSVIARPLTGGSWGR